MIDTVWLLRVAPALVTEPTDEAEKLLALYSEAEAEDAVAAELDKPLLTVPVVEPVTRCEDVPTPV